MAIGHCNNILRLLSTKHYKSQEFSAGAHEQASVACSINVSGASVQGVTLD
ncbi:hypothetical protein JYU34_004037 [Plutella xylostella]|uniref:Uncharacterized protein n=1 Tax=Plutella xylostella TaxID=51655 RepID=A0ABQ7QX05_PLUXY|nr:hypothetical protein JYU34_004037 [Plutella xylostella]